MSDATNAKMQGLIDSFPSLRRIGFRWNHDDSAEFVRLSKSCCHSSGEHHAACFVLYVWNRYDAPRGMKFDFHKAILAWDDEHVEAFRAWLGNIWYA